MKITIKGRIPSKKNSRMNFYRGGRAYSIPSKEYREWHEYASWQLPRLAKPLQPDKMVLRFYAPDKRKSDLSNKTESVMDLLVDNGIIEDDNWFVVPKLELEFGGIEKENPRVEISID